MADTVEKHDASDEATAFDSWRKPNNMSLSDWLENCRIARFEQRTYDWDALKFQADYDPKYRRSQMRYIGLGAAGAKSDGNVIPSENFTFSTMVLPAGCEGPSHVHAVSRPQRRDRGDDPERARRGFRSPRNISRAREYRSGRSTHVRHARGVQAQASHLSARSPAGLPQAGLIADGWRRRLLRSRNDPVALDGLRLLI